MKNKINTLLLITLFITFFSGCQKYEEGPKISLRSKKARLANDWAETLTIETGTSIVIGDYEERINYETTLKISKEGNYESNFYGSGTWEWVGDTGLRLKQETDEGTLSLEMEVLRLKNKELWIKYDPPITFGTILENTFEVHYEPK